MIAAGRACAVLAWDDLVTRAGGDEALARDILATMLRVLDDQEEALARAVAARDHALAARLAHALRGALATSGLARAAASAWVLESACERAASTVPLGRIFALVRVELALARRVARERLVAGFAAAERAS